MTTQNTILAAIALASSVTLSAPEHELLPSQIGQKGRRRLNGRVTVMRGNLSDAQFNLHTMRQVVATTRGIADSKTLTHYLRESTSNQITFVVPGLAADVRTVYLASVEAPVTATDETASLVEAVAFCALESEVCEPLEPTQATQSEENDALEIEAEA